MMKSTYVLVPTLLVTCFTAGAAQPTQVERLGWNKKQAGLPFIPYQPILNGVGALEYVPIVYDAASQKGDEEAIRQEPGERARQIQAAQQAKKGKLSQGF